MAEEKTIWSGSPSQVEACRVRRGVREIDVS